MNRFFSIALGFVLGAACSGPLGAATLVLVNVDPPGVGFNDATVVAAVPGNPATTRGAQRQAVFQRALDIWGAQLESPVTIRVQASFDIEGSGFGCAATPNAFVYLGFAGPTAVYWNFANVPHADTLYPVALRNALAGNVVNADTPEIHSRFNPLLDTTPDCLTGYDGYWYGLDPDAPPADRYFPLLPLVLHEIGHGLGFFTQTSLATGEQFLGAPTIYDLFLFDLQIGRFWNQMSDAQRAASAISDPNLVWAGRHVQRAMGSYLPLPQRMRAGESALPGAAQQAAFGPLTPRAGISGQVVAATPADACGALTNAAQVAGKLVLIDRGGCTFQVKVRQAQNAGASAVLVRNIDDDVGAPLTIMSGPDYSLAVPSVLLSFALGNELRSRVTSTPTTIFTLEPVPAAASPALNAGLMRMHAPATLSTGSSVSHFSTSAQGRLIMLPTINTALFEHTDMAPDLLRDLGWTLAPGVGVVVFEDDFE